MESFEKRLQRFLDGPPEEVFYSIYISLGNNILHDIKVALEHNLYTLAMFGCCAVMQTVGERIYDQRGLDATKYFLKKFVDDIAPEAKYSEIATYIHDYRNVLAHEWSSKSLHSLYIDTTLTCGWEKRGDNLHFNLPHFVNCFIVSFNQIIRLMQVVQSIPEANAKVRKYQFLALWLKLDKEDEIAKAIKALDQNDPDSLNVKINKIDKSIRARFL